MLGFAVVYNHIITTLNMTAQMVNSGIGVEINSNQQGYPMRKFTKTHISSVRTSVLVWDECILVENIHVTFVNICSKSAGQLTEFSSILPMRQRVRDYLNYITMDHTHLGDLSLH